MTRTSLPRLDDAALFPPGNAPMAAAVGAHLRHLTGPVATLVGPFVVSDNRLPELTRALAVEGVLEPIDVAVVVGRNADLPGLLPRMPGMRDLSLHAVETKVDSEREAREAAAHVAATEALFYLECAPDSPAFGEVLAAAARQASRIKLRTGGTTADAFPSAATLASAIQRCVRAGVPFKCTAGLHRAVRHRDPVTGFEHHGFLNLLLAAAVADHSSASGVAAVLQTTDPTAIVTGLSDLGTDGVARARERFVSFGTCSVSEPVEDLVALGLLPRTIEVAA